MPGKGYLQMSSENTGASPDEQAEDPPAQPEQAGGFSSPAPEAWGQPAPDSWGKAPQTPQPAEFSSPAAPDPWPGQQPPAAGDVGPTSADPWTEQEQAAGQFTQAAGGPSPTGQYPPGPNTPGEIPLGQYPPGSYAPGQYPPGETAPGPNASGQYPPGPGGPGQSSQGQFAPGQYPAGQYPPGSQGPGPYPPGQYPPGQFGYQPQYFSPATARNNRVAVWALICGVGQFLLGLTLVGNIVLAIPAIICGSIALKQIRQSGERGRGMAIAGLVLGILGIVYFLLVLVVIVVGVQTSSGSG
jgi:hypothetical protein